MASEKAIVPVLNALHPILVDASGALAKTEPAPGLFAAREALPYNLVDFDPYAVDALQSWAALDLSNAIFDISQTDIGADLLSAAWRAGIKFKFDSKACHEQNAGGFFENEKQTIVLTEWQSGAKQALIIVHELEHAMHTQDALATKFEDALSGRIHKSRIKEAASQAITGVFAYQVAMINAQDETANYQPQGILQAWEQMNPTLAKAAKAHSKLAIEGDWQAFAKKLFEAYPKDAPLVASYDHRQIGSVIGMITDHQKGDMVWVPDDNEPEPKLAHNKSDSDESLIAPLQIMGKSYVTTDITKRDGFSQLMPLSQVTKAYRDFAKQASQWNEAGYEVDTDVPRASLSLRLAVEVQHAKAIIRHPVSYTRYKAQKIATENPKLGRLAKAIGSAVLLAGMAGAYHGISNYKAEHADDEPTDGYAAMSQMDMNAKQLDKNLAAGNLAEANKNMNIIMTDEEVAWGDSRRNGTQPLEMAVDILSSIQKNKNLNEEGKEAVQTAIEYDRDMIAHPEGNHIREGSSHLPNFFKPKSGMY